MSFNAPLNHPNGARTVPAHRLLIDSQAADAAEELAMSAPEQKSGPDGYSGDQDIDTAGPEPDDEAAPARGPARRRRNQATSPDAPYADAPDNEHKPIGPSD